MFRIRISVSENEKTGGADLPVDLDLAGPGEHQGTRPAESEGTPVHPTEALYNGNAVIQESRDLKEVRRIVLNGLSGRRASVYLFGSWARGEASRISDIDVAILADAPLPPDVRADIEEALENSLSLYPVDLVDLSMASEGFRSRVLAEGILWTD